MRRREAKPYSECAETGLKQEIMLQINQRLFEKGMITKAMYDVAKIKIVNGYQTGK